MKLRVRDQMEEKVQVHQNHRDILFTPTHHTNVWHTNTYVCINISKSEFTIVFKKHTSLIFSSHCFHLNPDPPRSQVMPFQSTHSCHHQVSPNYKFPQEHPLCNGLKSSRLSFNQRGRRPEDKQT